MRNDRCRPSNNRADAAHTAAGPYPPMPRPNISRIHSLVLGLAEDAMLASTDLSARMTRMVWRISEDVVVGAKWLPYGRAGVDFELAVPPAQIMRYCETFPWSANAQWASPSAVRFHMLVIERVRRLHRTTPLRGALLQDEAWTYWLDPSMRGIFVSVDIANAAGLAGEHVDDLVSLPLIVEDRSGSGGSKAGQRGPGGSKGPG